jgi:hypothetical protein
MYILILIVHSWLRWLIVLAGVLAVVTALRGRGGWKMADEKWGRIFSVALDVQFMFGILLYGFLSPLTRMAFDDMGAAMRISTTRFWAVEHVTLTLAALAVAHIGVARVRKAQDPAIKRRRGAIMFGIALLLVLAAVPWPNLTYGRPLFRFGP